MNIKRILLSIGLSLAVQQYCHSAELHTIGGPFSNISLPSNGAVHTYVYTNKTGGPIYIAKVKVFILGGGYTGTVTGWMETWGSTGTTTLSYFSRYVDDGHPQGAGAVTANQITDDFSPNYVMINPGDQIALIALSNGFGGVASFISAWVWYSTVQP
jgi:hypothetical protein